MVLRQGLVRVGRGPASRAVLVDVESGSMIFAEIVLRGSFPVWLAIVLMVIAAGIAAAFYFTESMKLGVGRRLVLAGLRALVLAAIVFLLCKPVAVRDVSMQKS